MTRRSSVSPTAPPPKQNSSHHHQLHWVRSAIVTKFLRVWPTYCADFNDTVTQNQRACNETRILEQTVPESLSVCAVKRDDRVGTFAVVGALVRSVMDGLFMDDSLPQDNLATAGETIQ